MISTMGILTMKNNDIITYSDVEFCVVCGCYFVCQNLESVEKRCVDCE
jgi:hypothetical protein